MDVLVPFSAIPVVYGNDFKSSLVQHRNFLSLPVSYYTRQLWSTQVLDFFQHNSHTTNAAW